MNANALLESITDDTAVQDMLVMHMPEDLQTRDELLKFLRTPQFRQAIDQLAVALSSENMYQVLMSMGVDPSAAPYPGVEGFLQALISTLSKKLPAAAPKAEETKPAEEEDDLDADLYD